MARSTVTLRGQTVVPAKIRKQYHIEPNSKLQWIDDGDTIRIIPLPGDVINSSRGITKGFGDQLLKERSMERRLDR